MNFDAGLLQITLKISLLALIGSIVVFIEIPLNVQNDSQILTSIVQLDDVLYIHFGGDEFLKLDDIVEQTL